MGFAVSYTDAAEALEAKKSILETSNSNIPQAVGIASSSKSLYIAPAQLFDQLALDKVTIINNKKTTIVTGLGVSCAVTTADGFSASDLKSNVTANFGNIITGSPDTAIGTAVGLGTTSIVGYATVRQDAWRGYYYPPIEDEDYTTNSPLEGQDWITITSSNLGIGVSVSLWENYSGGTVIGTVYSISTTSCAGYATSLALLNSQITALRSGIATYRSAGNIMKDLKTKYDLQIWAYNRTIQTNNDTIAGLSSAITLLQQYEGQY